MTESGADRQAVKPMDTPRRDGAQHASRCDGTDPVRGTFISAASDSRSGQLHVCVDTEPCRGQRPAGVSGPQGGGGSAVNHGAETGRMEAGRGGGGGRRAYPEYVFQYLWRDS